MPNRFTHALRVLFGSVEEQLRTPLEREQRKAGYNTLHGEGLTNAERSVLIQVSQTLARYDLRRAGRLLKRQHRLIKAARRNLASWQEVLAAQEDPRWTGHWREGGADEPAYPDEAEVPDGRGRVPGFLRARRSDFREDFDPHRPLIGERVLLAAELVLLVVEVTFWYGVFSADVEPDASWTDPQRLSAALLALFLPTAGILAARVLGGLGHRWAVAYPGTGRRERLGTIVAAVIAAIAVVATAKLVYDRFDEAQQQLGAVPVPAGPMAVIFAVVLLADMAARVFLTSEIRQQTIERRKALRKVRQKAIKANAAHARAWIDLRSEVQVQLDRCERVVAIGATLINDERASSEHEPVRELFGCPRPSHGVDAIAGDGPADRMSVPNSEQLRMFGGTLTLTPLRTVDDAIDTLDHWRPRGHPSVGEDLHTIREQLLRLEMRLPRQSEVAGGVVRPRHGDGPAVSQPRELN